MTPPERIESPRIVAEEPRGIMTELTEIRVNLEKHIEVRYSCGRYFLGWFFMKSSMFLFA
jgi:hypothetical protein